MPECRPAAAPPRETADTAPEPAIKQRSDRTEQLTLPTHSLRLPTRELLLPSRDREGAGSSSGYAPTPAPAERSRPPRVPLLAPRTSRPKHPSRRPEDAPSKRRTTGTAKEPTNPHSKAPS